MKLIAARIAVRLILAAVSPTVAIAKDPDRIHKLPPSVFEMAPDLPTNWARPKSVPIVTDCPLCVPGAEFVPGRQPVTEEPDIAICHIVDLPHTHTVCISGGMASRPPIVTDCTGEHAASEMCSGARPYAGYGVGRSKR